MRRRCARRPYALGRPVDRPPGEVLNHVTGAPTLLGAVPHKLTGRPFDTLEHDVLLDPPGISDVACDNRDPTGGAQDAAARSGPLVLLHGGMSGKSFPWLGSNSRRRRGSTTPIRCTSTAIGQWWLGRSLLDDRHQIDWTARRGFGGHWLIIRGYRHGSMAWHDDSPPLPEIIGVNLLIRVVLPAIVKH